MNNVSGNHSSSHLAPAGQAAAGQVSTRARLLVQTAATLSLAGPRRIAPGRGSRRQQVMPDAASVSLPPVVSQKRVHARKASGVRVRQPGPATARRRDEQAVGQQRSPVNKTQGKKRKKTTEQWHKATDSARSASAGSRRRHRRSEALDDFSLVRRAGEGAGRSRRAAAACVSGFVPLGQKNFSRIHDNPAGCYRLAENVTIEEDHQPPGNRSRPFTGSFEAAGYRLAVNLTRSQGDALLFGYVNNSHIDLDLVASQLKTGNGSRAALIGELGMNNHVTLSRLQDSTFDAEGEGEVHAGLVAVTTGDRNRLELREAVGNQVVARSHGASGSCSLSCRSAAMSSLGLGVIQTAGEQVLIQHQLQANRLVSEADGILQTRSASGATSTHAQASSALLGVLDDTELDDTELDDKKTDTRNLWSLQQDVHNNTLQAFAGSTAGTLGHTSARSDASLGYGGWRPDSPAALNRTQTTLVLSQAGCSNNRLQARSRDVIGDSQARVAFASTAPLSRLDLLHRAIGAGEDQLVVQHRAEPMLLAPAKSAYLVLLSGGQTDWPLFPSWGTPTPCSRYTTLDTAGYQLGSLDCPAPSWEWLNISSLEPYYWRQARERLAGFDKGLFLGPGASGTSLLPEESCAYSLSAVHYPHEVLQALIPHASGWWLVTRQQYPWRPENNAQGLIRVTGYKAPETRNSLPRLAVTGSDSDRLYRPVSGDAPLPAGVPVQSLVQGQRLRALYQPSGQMPQLLTLPLNKQNGDYRLEQYPELPGEARLLSVENNELTLWMQQDNNDTVLAYGLGTETAAVRDVRPVLGIDLSDQPGGKALLARDGDWLYSLRQPDGLPASLRRFTISAGSALMDPDWQPLWPGNITGQEWLIVHRGQLTALPPGALIDPAAPDVGLSVQVPELGGCLRWSQVALVHHRVSESVAPSRSESFTAARALLPSSSPAPSSSASVTGQPAGMDVTAGLVAGVVVVVAVVGVGVGGGLGVATCCLAFVQHARQRQRQQQEAEQIRMALLPLESLDSNGEDEEEAAPVRPSRQRRPARSLSPVPEEEEAGDEETAAAPETGRSPTPPLPPSGSDDREPLCETAF